MRVMQRALLAVVLAGTMGCASARHIAVVADATFAQAVIAVDDAQFEACKTNTPPFTVEVCKETDPKIDAALQHVKTITAMLQATPRGAELPKDLPSLLKTLTEVQAILSPLTTSPTKLEVVAKIQNALARAIALLSLFTGGVQ